jgi:hypothetical protein
MKNSRWLPCFVIPILAASCLMVFGFKPKTNPGTQPITGHFTHQNKPETLVLITPKMNSNETDCAGGCTTQIKFSDPAIPAISVKDAIGGELANLGDLNNDGLDEIGLLPGWFNGCWHDYRVYTFKQKQWHLAVPPFPTHCNQWEANVKPIVPDSQHPGEVVITYSVIEGNEIVFKKKSEPIK